MITFFDLHSSLVSELKDYERLMWKKNLYIFLSDAFSFYP